MEIGFILPGGGIKSFDSTPADSIENLKHKIEEKEGIPVHKQTLFYSDFILRNDHHLHDYYIHRNSTVDLLVLFSLLVFLPDGKPVQMESDYDEIRYSSCQRSKNILSITRNGRLFTIS